MKYTGEDGEPASKDSLDQWNGEYLGEINFEYLLRTLPKVSVHHLSLLRRAVGLRFRWDPILITKHNKRISNLSTHDSHKRLGCVHVPCLTSESALRSAEILLSRVRVPPPAPWPDTGPENLRLPCCGLAIHKNKTFHICLFAHLTAVYSSASLFACVSETVISHSF
ncbi:hypothetical protein PoB_004793000 [Plakobranchus ocellatus]|uniref:Uncharacterized protein n=1 Tax=Plakobranchus ocellatus TaxID=259542 RepID=A0AAV4BPP2_9GAST|nr:hypothetical protein PoB_004793000 [Plakobranchus ocellatus]